jgi:hypothetical protein
MNNLELFCQIGLDSFINQECDKNIDWLDFFQLSDEIK